VPKLSAGELLMREGRATDMNAFPPDLDLRRHLAEGLQRELRGAVQDFLLAQDQERLAKQRKDAAKRIARGLAQGMRALGVDPPRDLDFDNSRVPYEYGRGRSAEAIADVPSDEQRLGYYGSLLETL
jgi:hypothetical protein